MNLGLLEYLPWTSSVIALDFFGNYLGLFGNYEGLLRNKPRTYPKWTLDFFSIYLGLLR
jgi:hypothetical protein